MYLQYGHIDGDRRELSIALVELVMAILDSFDIKWLLKNLFKINFV